MQCLIMSTCRVQMPFWNMDFVFLRVTNQGEPSMPGTSKEIGTYKSCLFLSIPTFIQVMKYYFFFQAVLCHLNSATPSLK